MPVYDYQCTACGEQVEVIHGAEEKYKGKCEKCGASLQKLFIPVGIVFKGSGFYINDSKKSDTPTVSTPAKAEAAKP